MVTRSLVVALTLLITPAWAGGPETSGLLGAVEEQDGPADPTDSDLGEELAPSIVNGEETRDYDTVGALVAAGGGGASSFCSATLISEHEVLTAAHCVDALNDYLRGGVDAYVVFGDNLNAGQVEFSSQVVEAFGHPDWNRDVSAGADIGIVRMETSYGAVAPTPLYGGDAYAIPVGELFDYVGFGVTFDNGGDSGIKRHTEKAFTRVSGDFLLSEDLETNLCSGDSGGAGLRREGDGIWSIVGVNSFVYDIDGDRRSCITGGSGITRVDLFRAWILENSDATVFDPSLVTDPGDGVVDETTNFGDWDLPERPPEDAVGTCSSVSTTGGAGLLGLAALGALLARRRRRS